MIKQNITIQIKHFFLLVLSVMSELIQRYTTNLYYFLLSVHLGILTLTINGNLCVKNKQTTQNTGFFGVFFLVFLNENSVSSI